MTAMHRRPRTGAAIGAVALAALIGCDKPAPGPRRDDHAAAHARRYHPDVRRTDAAGTPASAPAPAVTQPSDITFDHAASIGCPVLFVNDESFTVPELIEPIVQDLADKADTLPLPAYRNYVFRAVNNQIDYLISLSVLYQEAKRVYSDEKVQQAFDKEADRLVRDVINRRYGGVTARYEAHLKALDLKRDDIKARARRQAMVTQFLHERFKPLASEPSRREILAYYQAHTADFTSPARARLLLIDIPLAKELDKPVSRASAAELAEARTRARSQLTRAREELAAGADFAAVARKYGKGIRCGTGGDWGEITPGALVGRWARAAEVLFSLSQGQVSHIVETPDSLFLVKCGSLTPQRTVGFEEAQESIIDKLAEEDFNHRREAYVQELLAKATVGRRQEFFEAVLAAVPRPAALRDAPARSTRTP